MLIVASIVIAYLNLLASKKKSVFDLQTQKDKEVFEQAIQSLRWAYETVTDGMENGVPDPCRLKWLTGARHISRYYKLKELLLTDTYKLICEENEEYWRHKFYVLLNQQALRVKQYYVDESNGKWPENIELKSAMIINDFANWQEYKIDPLDDINREELIKNGKPFHGECGRGIESYYCMFEEIKHQMEREHETEKA